MAVGRAPKVIITIYRLDTTGQAKLTRGLSICSTVNNTMDPNSRASWRVPMAVQIPPAALILVGAFVLHESPLWLLRKGKDEQAFRALEALRKLPIHHQCMFFPLPFNM